MQRFLLAAALMGGVVHANPREEYMPKFQSAFTTNARSRRQAKRMGSVESALEGLEYTVTSDYVSEHNALRHMYFQQTLGGVPVKNAVASATLKNGEVLAFHSSMYTGAFAAQRVAMDASTAKGRAMMHLEASASDCEAEVEPELFYVQVGTDKVELAYRVECDLNTNWMETYVSAETGAVVAQLDYFHNAVEEEAQSGQYSVFTIPDVDPGMAQNQATVASLPHEEAYPAEAGTLGWHSQGNGRTFTDTRGNNVYAQENLRGSSSWENNYRPDGGASLDFNFTYDFTKEPDEPENLDSAIANLFFLNNLQHDIFYGYGFTEAAGNFQENNLGRGGRENDAVQANAQDGSGTNNANFATPADGSRPRMRMYVWDGFTPARDGDLEAGIVFHEYGHGITNRLTGGPSSTGCLSGVANGAGMGEGWSDFFGKIIALKDTDKAEDSYPMGDWVSEGGIRTYPYSRDFGNNPLTFAYLNNSPYSSSVHAAGTIWCTTLWDAMWDMIDIYGFDKDIRAIGRGGNNKMLQLVVDALKIQPCRPSMLEARDAIVTADEATYDGEHFCLLWNAFARRGFGVNAATPSGFFGQYTEDFSVPAECA